MAQMNVKRFKSVLSDSIRAAALNGSKHSKEIIEYATKRITELGESKDTDSLRIEDELVNIIDAIAAEKETPKKADS